MYQNLSNAMWLASPQTMAKAGTASDPLMAATLANIDAKRYRALNRPPWATFRMLIFFPRMIWRLRGVWGNTLWALLAPQRVEVDGTAGVILILS